MEVGVRDLKEHLSEYLDHVEAGDLIKVTRRGRAIAILAPMVRRGEMMLVERVGPGRLQGSVHRASGSEKLERGLEEGWITLKEHVPPRSVKRHTPRPGTPSTTELIRQDRDS